MDDELITPTPQPEGEDIAPPDGGEANSAVAGNPPATPEQKYLADINRATGKNFKSLDDVAKTIASAHKLAEEVGNLRKQAGAGDELSRTLGDLTNRFNQSEFYKLNPKYDTSEIKELLGDNPAETIKNEKVKSLIDKAVEHDEFEKSKSVLKSNARLGKINDTQAEAKEAAKSGNLEEAKRLGVKAVMDVNWVEHNKTINLPI